MARVWFGATLLEPQRINILVRLYQIDLCWCALKAAHLGWGLKKKANTNQWYIPLLMSKALMTYLRINIKVCIQTDFMITTRFINECNLIII